MADAQHSALAQNITRMESQLQANQAELRANKAELQVELRANANEMAEMKEEMRSRIQLLMSRVAALSSQFQQAPGIFDGANQRKLDAENAGKQVSVKARQRQVAFFDMGLCFVCTDASKRADVLISEYPMFLCPISTLLQFERLPSVRMLTLSSSLHFIRLFALHV